MALELSARAWGEELPRLVRNLLQAHACHDYVTPAEFSRAQISFRGSNSAAHARYRADLTPYLEDVLQSWEFSGVRREVTVVAPEQTGKTLSWLIGLLWSFLHKPCLSLVVYPSDDLAEQINSDKLLPVMRAIPRLASELALPRSKRTDCYHFTTTTSYFMGSGSRVTSVSAKITIADELDDWIEHEGQVANLEDVRKRTRSFSESMLFKVCTPSGDGDGSAIWQEFQQSSRGYWHLRCMGCGGLTMRSCDVHNLQWETTGDDKVIGDSVRLICPVCKREHVEAEKARLNSDGGYVHEDAELLVSHPGFQWGALASQVPDLGWLNIARAQMRAGRSGDYKDQLLFDNSIRGLPYVRRRSQDSEENILRKHCADLPPREAIKYVLMAADTQNDGWFYIVRGFDDKKNSYLLSNGKAMEMDDLISVIDGEHYGKRVSLAIIDQGGHRAKEIQELSHRHKRVVSYKGSTTMYINRWEVSKSDRRLVLANPKIYQAELLFQIYQRTNAAESGWYLPRELSQEYVDQILDLKPNKKMRAGHDYKNWDGTGNDHYFDAEKMLIVCRDVARKDGEVAKPQVVLKPKTSPVGWRIK